MNITPWDHEARLLRLSEIFGPPIRDLPAGVAVCWHPTSYPFSLRCALEGWTESRKQQYLSWRQMWRAMFRR